MERHEQLLVLIEGRNYRTDFGDGEEVVGFLANRLVDAESADAINKQDLFRRVRDELATNNIAATERSTMWMSRVSPAPLSSTHTYEGFSFYSQEGVLRRLFRKLWDFQRRR